MSPPTPLSALTAFPATLPPILLHHLTTHSILKPTPIQATILPHLHPIPLTRAIIGIAPTGTGKTLAFLLPILADIIQDPFGVHSLIITPTRELAVQINQQIQLIAPATRTQIIVGGENHMTQFKQIPHVIVATPGRLADHLELMKTPIPLHNLKYLVIDEADRILTDTYTDNMKQIIAKIPPKEKRITLMFSATLNQKLRDIASDQIPLFEIKYDESQLHKLQKYYVMIQDTQKITALIWLVQNMWVEGEGSVIIFVNSRKVCEQVTHMFRSMTPKLPSIPIHGELSQAQRNNHLASFRSGLHPILIATSIVARGLDVPQVKLVINFDVPANSTDFVHRIGRTARAGLGGKCVTIVGTRDLDCWVECEKRVGKSEEIPIDDKDVLALMDKAGRAWREGMLFMEEHEFGQKRKINIAKEGPLKPKGRRERPNHDKSNKRTRASIDKA